ncbi:MAG: bifunctional methylenetetrahydrofolate dehydrogenase/methenyltetrahydrofolate cyclohydrolase FolD [Chlamydiota bacterium]
MIINGKKIAESLRSEIKEKIEKLPGRKPSLAFILIGNHPASLIYVINKKKACREVGIETSEFIFPESISETFLIEKIQQLNEDPLIDGILVQLPLPKHIVTQKIIECIDPQKDVDGFHPLNVGKMLLGDPSALLPCTPQGIKVLLEKSHISPEGKHVVILGRSNIVGKPLAAILLQNAPGCNATITIAHSHSKHLMDITKSADILVAAVGKPHFVKKEFVTKGVVIIDVGINRITVNNKTTLVGDVDFNEVAPLASAITPVPGGVGPMTVALLLQNVLSCYSQKKYNISL